jgi:hypothetical protein
MPEPKRRRSDQIFDPSYLGGLEDRPVEELQTMRDECDEVENEISYDRRLAQARIDILLAELDHREGKAGNVISRLPEILAAEGGGGGGSPLPERAPDLSPPDNAGGPRRRVEEIAGRQTLARLSEMAPDEIKELIDSLVAYEKDLSAKRRTLHELLDKIQAEIVSRYTTGEASSDAVLGR